MQLRHVIFCLIASIGLSLPAASQPNFDVEQFCTEVAGGSYRVYQVCVEDELNAQSEIVRVQRTPMEMTPPPEPTPPDSDVATNSPGQEQFVVCDFDNMPLVLMRFRGGMGASDNTVQIGNDEPLALSVGSGMMLASRTPYEYTFSLHEPATVSVHHLGDSNARTFNGECIAAK